MLRPKPTVDRKATEEELKCIEETEEMLKEEKKLPPASQMIRNIATDHWKSLKSWIKGSQVIAPQEIAQRRWDICKGCDKLLYDEMDTYSHGKDSECILAIAEGQYQDVQVVDKEINFMSTIVKLLRIIR